MAKKRATTKSSTAAQRRNRLADELTASPPPKARPRRADPSFSTHKVRARWFNAREAWPLREAPLRLLHTARAHAATSMPCAVTTAQWAEAGPTNIGGRTTSLVVDPDDPARIWIGSAGGGVWATVDGGTTWTPQWHAEPTLNIGSLCADPDSADTIYCGTGEANLSADSHPGVGIYRTLDGGANWHLLASAEGHGLPRRIGRVAVDPFDGQRLFAAGVGHQNHDPRGLFRSLDGGNSWALVTALFKAPYHCHEVVFHPSTPGTVYATIDANGSRSGVWRSADGGQQWTQLPSGFPHPSLMARTSLAVAPSNPNVLYAQVASRTGDVLGVFRSSNGGDTWREVGGRHFDGERQMNYNNTISVAPDDADTVLCGGVDIHRTTNGGTSWRKETRWDAARGSSNYAHADQHGLLHHPLDPMLVFAVNDGGLDVSHDGGRNWANKSYGLATNMFYDLSVAAANGNMYGGGMQDNGTWLTLDGDPDGFVETTGGDGGFCAIDPTEPFHLFTSSQNMRINRFRPSDGWSRNIGPNDQVRPWMAFIAIDPARPRRVFVGSRRVFRSLDDGASWADKSGILDGSFISCIEISRADTDRVYVGTENGGIFVSTDGGSTWTGNIASSALPGRTITRLRTTADDADVVYATVANFGNSHLFRSIDGGATWADVDGGNLPDSPHHAVAIPAGDPDTIFVAGDAGVLRSDDGAATWTNITLNLPTVMVVDLVLHEPSGTLTAATYGRSTWQLDVS